MKDLFVKHFAGDFADTIIDSKLCNLFLTFAQIY